MTSSEKKGKNERKTKRNKDVVAFSQPVIMSNITIMCIDVKYNKAEAEEEEINKNNKNNTVHL